MGALQNELDLVKLSNNSYDEKSMHDAVRLAWESSYSYLMSKQKDTELFEHFHFDPSMTTEDDITVSRIKDYGHFYTDKFGRCKFDIKYDLINQSAHAAYRSSVYYNKKFTLDSMILNQHIFTVIPVVMIDGKIVWDYEMEVNAGTTSFILPFKRSFVYDIVGGVKSAKQHIVDIYIIKNIYFQHMNAVWSNFSLVDNKLIISKNIIKSGSDDYTDTAIRKEFYSINNYDNDFILNTEQDEKFRIFYNNKKVAADIPDDSRGTMFMTIHVKNPRTNTHVLSTSDILPLTYNADNQTYSTEVLSTEVIESIQNSPYGLYLSVLFIENLFPVDMAKTSKSNTPNEHVIFTLSDENDNVLDLPVPTRNILVYNGKLNTGSDLNIQHYYPNIYIYNNANDIDRCSSIFYFYHKFDDIKFESTIDFFNKYLKSLSKLTNLSISRLLMYSYDKENNDIDPPTGLSKYIPSWTLIDTVTNKYPISKYGEIDFVTNYTIIPENSSDTPEEYKVKTLKSFIAKDHNILRDYVLYESKVPQLLSLHCNTLDLTSRIREDTYDEEFENGKELPENCYVFATNRILDNRPDAEYVVFVDGKEIPDTYQTSHALLDYIYIPTRYINSDSYIELEQASIYLVDIPYKFTAVGDTVSVDLSNIPSELRPVARDLKIVQFMEDLNNNGLTIPNMDNRPQYSVKLYNDDSNVSLDLDYSELSSSTYEFAPLQKFDITLESGEVSTINTHIYINKQQHVRHMSLKSKSGFPVITLSTGSDVYDKDTLRIFRNGRLLLDDQYRITTSNGAEGYKKNSNQMIIRMTNYYSEDLDVDIVTSPFKYKKIAYYEEINNDDIIDLSGTINKPFDFRYYEVYLNGRKMNSETVTAIDETHIKFHGVHSDKNLVIYEKERSYEYFGFNYLQDNTYKTINLLDDISDNDIKTAYLEELISSNKTNDTTEQNIVGLDEDTVGLLFIEFYRYYVDMMIKLKYINPDGYQTNDYRSASGLYEHVSTVFIEDISTEKAFNIDPDKKLIIGDDNNQTSIVEPTAPESDVMSLYVVGHQGLIDESEVDMNDYKDIYTESEINALQISDNPEDPIDNNLKDEADDILDMIKAIPNSSYRTL